MQKRFFAVLGAVVSTFLCGLTAQAEWNGKIIDVRDGKKEVPLSVVARKLSTAHNVILGEKHDTQAVQQGQSEVIEAVVEAAGRRKDFTVAWEFLNHRDQDLTTEAFNRFVKGELTVEALLDLLQGEGNNRNYAPILEITKREGGKFIGVNISRADKNPVTRGGIKAADPALVPPNFERGTPGYRERFAETMRNHVPASKIDNYYDAQCLTDDVMAYWLNLDSDSPLKFLVVGFFHTDYFDGVVHRLNVRYPWQRTMVVRFVDASDFTEENLLPQVHDDQYGDVADFVYFVNEPKASTR